MGTELCCLALQLEKAHETLRVWHAKVALQIVLATGNVKEVAQQRTQPRHCMRPGLWSRRGGGCVVEVMATKYPPVLRGLWGWLHLNISCSFPHQSFLFCGCCQHIPSSWAWGAQPRGDGPASLVPAGLGRRVLLICKTTTNIGLLLPPSFSLLLFLFPPA